MPETIDMLVDGGKATPTPAVAQKLGPMKINIGEVMNKINEKTSSFQGMQVPVKININKDKSFDISVGTPPTSDLIKKELKLEKGSGTPDKQKVANISIEECIKIAKMKIGSMYTDNLKSAVKSIAGSCNSLGVLIEGKSASEICKEIEKGEYDSEINFEKTEPSEEKKKILKKQLKEVQAEITKKLEKLKAVEEAEKEAVTIVETEEVKAEKIEEKEAEKEGQVEKAKEAKIKEEKKK